MDKFQKKNRRRKSLIFMGLFCASLFYYLPAIAAIGMFFALMDYIEHR